MKTCFVERFTSSLCNTRRGSKDVSELNFDLFWLPFWKYGHLMSSHSARCLMPSLGVLPTNMRIESMGFKNPLVSMNISCRHLGAPPTHLCINVRASPFFFWLNSIEDTWKKNRGGSRPQWFPSGTALRLVKSKNLSPDLLVDSKGDFYLLDSPCVLYRQLEGLLKKDHLAITPKVSQ